MTDYTYLRGSHLAGLSGGRPERPPQAVGLPHLQAVGLPHLQAVGLPHLQAMGLPHLAGLPHLQATGLLHQEEAR